MLKLVDRVHLQEICLIKTGFLPNYQIIKIHVVYPTELQYNFILFFGGQGWGKWVGRWRTNKHHDVASTSIDLTSFRRHVPAGFHKELSLLKS